MPSRPEIERKYRERMEARQADYHDAKAAAAAAYIQLKEKALPEPDGSQAYRNALVLERQTLRAYINALHQFTDLVVQGKLPEPDE